MLLLTTSCHNQNSSEFESAFDYSEEEIQEIQEAIQSINERRTEFVKALIESLNAPGLPLMCEKAYFNS